MPGWFHPGSLDSSVDGDQKASSAGLRFLSQTDGLDSSGAFPGNRLFLRPWPHDVDSGSIELRLQMRRIVFLNHLHACPAVLGNLIDVGTFKQAQANVGVAQAIRRSRPSVTVGAKLFFLKDCVEQLAWPFREQKIGGSGRVPLTVGH